MDPNIVLGILIMDDEIEEDEDRELVRMIRLHRAQLRDASNPLEQMPRELFRQHYRFQKETVAWLCELLAPRIQQQRNTMIPTMLQVLCTLRFLAQGCYQLSIGESGYQCMSQTSVSRVVHRVAALMADLANEWVRFPQTVAERARVSAGFQAIAGFPGIIGCIDGTQVPISPPSEMPWMYLNHNRTHSLNVQATCDHEMRVTSVTFFPGSTHDARMWRESAVKQEMNRLHRDRVGLFHLLGDQGYPLQPGMLTPYRNPEPGIPRALYNNSHTHTRSGIERLYGIWKGVWRCLKRDRTLHYKPAVAGRFIKACAFLHNVGVQLRDRPEVVDNVQDIDAQLEVNVDDDDIANRGRFIREHIVDQYFNNHVNEA